MFATKSNENKTVALKQGKTEFLIVDDVKIFPGEIRFENAFDSKEYSETLTIQNCGRKKALIRILTPSSFAVKIKVLERGQYLSPGLSIKRKIYFTYFSCNHIYKSLLPIQINGKQVDYCIYITLCDSILTIEPMVLDFGSFCIGQNLEAKDLILKNIGSKTLQYSIDINNTDTAVIVNPKRGIIVPSGSVSVVVKLLINEEGYFEKEFWLKANDNSSFNRVIIKGTAKIPKLIVSSPFHTKNFVLVNFRRTYLGSYREKYLKIENKTDTIAPFCILGEVNLREYPLSEAVTVDPNYKHFKLSSHEGLIYKQESRIFCFMFLPILEKEFEQNSDFEADYSCILKLVRMDYRIGGRIKQLAVYSSKIIVPETSMPEIIGPYCSRYYADDKSLDKQQIDIPTFNLPTEAVQKIWLYGMVEKPRISVVPDSLHLKELKINEQQQRVLKITNLSENLPITIKYKKVPFVEVNPACKVLQPTGSFELNISVKCFKLGEIKEDIKFELLHKYYKESEYFKLGEFAIPIVLNVHLQAMQPKIEFNLGLTPFLFNEVGRHVDNITFGTDIELPKMAIIHPKFLVGGDDDLIAFPNDRPQSIRSCSREKQCKTIFTFIPSVFVSNSTINQELFIKKERGKIYSTYLKKEARKRLQYLNLNTTAIDYDITNTKLLLCEDMKQVPGTETKNCVTYNFLPMTPLELFNVIINPRHIYAGKVAVVSPCECKFSIENKNNFDIRVLLQSVYENLEFVDGDRRVIGAHKIEFFKFVIYVQRNEGVFTKNLEIVINDNHIFDIDVTGVIVPRSLEVDTNEIVFQDSSWPFAYINMYNHFSTDISYCWDYPDSCFELEPSNGYIEPLKCSCCLVHYSSEKTLPTSIEAFLLSDGKLSEVIKISAETIENPVELNVKELDLKGMPINMISRRYVELRNTSVRLYRFNVSNPDSVQGINVTPQEGFIKGKEIISLEITVEVTECINFTADVMIQVHDYRPKTLKIKGNVVIPTICITPPLLKFKKIPNHSVDTLLFTIKNENPLKAKISFDLSQNKEFSITKVDSLSNVNNITLEMGEYVRLCLWFRPIDVSIQTFLLPIILNDIIGPPTDNFLLEFLEDHEKRMRNKSIVAKNPFLSVLPKIRIQSTVTGCAISLNKSLFSFQYYPNPDFDTIMEDELVITNDTELEQSFFIRINQVIPPFKIDPVKSKRIRDPENIVSANLLAHETVKFTLRFQPREPGLFKCVMPIHVKTYHGVYNYIECEARFPAPTIAPSISMIYLEPIPLRTSSQQEFSIIARYHVLVCKINTSCKDPDLKIKCQSKTIDPRIMENVIIVSVSFSSKRAKAVEERIDFSCSCGSKCYVMVKGCTDNCSFTSHAFIKTFCQNTMNINSRLYDAPNELTTDNFDIESMSIADISQIFEEVTNINQTTFPYFPTEDELNFDHMQTTVKLVEHWIYSEVLSGTKYLSIPDGFAFTLPNQKSVPKGITTKEELPITAVINFYTGSEYSSKFSINRSNFPSEYIEQIQYIWHIYREIKNMLQEVGALLPNIEPEYLLTYYQYVDYQKCILPKQNPDRAKEKPLDQNEFVLISTQNWLDILLQMQKVFLLYTKSRSLLMQPSENAVLQEDIMLTLDAILTSKDPNYDNNIYHPVENMVMYWLQYVYNENRHLVESVKLPERIIKLLDVDLFDSMVFAVVTMAYCPYLKSEFDCFYWNVDNYNEALVNACRLLTAWNKIEMGILLDPRDIVTPNLLQMLLVVCNFYDFLSSVSPIIDINIEAQLSFKTKTAIMIGNQNEFIVKYKLIFFNNELGSFSSQHNEYILKPKSTVSVVITYWPKFLQHVDVYLLFNGTNFGYHCAQNQCFHLFGKTLIDSCYQQMSIKGVAYEKTVHETVITSPYEAAGMYELLITFKSPTVLEELALQRFVDFQNMMGLPKRLILQEYNMATDDEGKGCLRFILNAYMPIDVIIWLFFENKQIGVFSSKIDVKAKKEIVFNPLEVGVTQKFLSMRCTCKNKKINMSCPKVLSITVPQRYEMFWKPVKDMFFAQVERSSPEDLEFWKEHFATAVGASIMRRYLKDFVRPKHISQMDKIFEFYGTFYIILPEPIEGVIFPDEIPYKIQCATPLTFYIHVDRDSMPENMKFMMVFLKDCVSREYEINFVMCD